MSKLYESPDAAAKAAGGRGVCDKKKMAHDGGGHVIEYAIKKTPWGEDDDGSVTKGWRGGCIRGYILLENGELTPRIPPGEEPDGWMQPA